MTRSIARPWLLLTVVTLTVLAGGCRTMSHAPALEPRDQARFDGHDGTPITWEDLVARAADADVVILGEQHDDATGHFVQQTLIADVLDRAPTGAVSMEMIERDGQLLVDDHLAGLLDARLMARRTGASSWNGWETWYQPSVDAARERDVPVIAANAPRRYVRLARTDGFDRLRALDGARATWVRVPEDLPEGAYRERFWEVMDGPEAVVDEDTEAHEARIEALYRAQSVWDATMADSIARALADGRAPVIHLVGQFHSDFEGGLVQHLRRYAPDASILVISMQPGTENGLREEDEGRADIVVYTTPE